MIADPAPSPLLPKPGWRRRLLCLALGAGAGLAFAPVYAVPLLWPAFTVLALAAQGARRVRDAALDGWAFGVGFFAVGLYWIGYAFLVDGDRYAWMMPFAVAGMAAGMALYIALAAGLMRAVAGFAGIGRMSAPLVFACVWMIAEWLRGWLFTGFPWNPIASVWAFSPAMMQSAAWIGSPGLGFLTALAFAAPAAFLGAGWRPDRSPSGRKGLAVFAAATAVLPVLALAGAWRLADADMTDRDGIMLRVVQANVQQKLKWVPELRRGHVVRQMAMSRRSPGPAGPPTHVIWPETAVPFVVSAGNDVSANLAAAVPKGGALIFGAPRRDAGGNFFNSAFAIDDDGRVHGTYDKFHLVPFGEYVPLRGILPIEKLTAGRGDFSSGPGLRALEAPGLPPFGVLICYEIIFPGQVVDPAARPGWLLNLTNDGWFGISAGPYQHLVQARFRAVEEGLPVVRAANTGISAVIDAYGRVRGRIGLGEQDVLDAPLPVALPPTVFAVMGATPAALAPLLILGVLVFLVRRRKIAD